MKWMHLGCGPGQYYTGSTCQACPKGTSEAATGESLINICHMRFHTSDEHSI